MFSKITFSSNDLFPTGTLIFLLASTLNSIVPALAPLMALVRSYGDTNVPAFGLGINPLVPKSLANGFKCASISWVAINFSNLYVPSLIDFKISS